MRSYAIGLWSMCCLCFCVTGCQETSVPDANTTTAESSSKAAAATASVDNSDGEFPLDEMSYKELLDETTKANDEERGPLVTKLIEIIKKDPASTDFVKSLPTLAKYGGADATEIMDLALEHHSASPHFSFVLRAATKMDNGEEFLARVANNAKDGVTRHTAMFWQTQLIQGQEGELDLLRQIASFDGEISLGPKDLKAMAVSRLFSLENLQVGKEAPDIVAADVHGEEFKLSDYRGKVVLLDFWGDW